MHSVPQPFNQSQLLLLLIVFFFLQKIAKPSQWKVFWFEYFAWPLWRFQFSFILLFQNLAFETPYTLSNSMGYTVPTVHVYIDIFQNCTFQLCLLKKKSTRQVKLHPTNKNWELVCNINLRNLIIQWAYM